MEFNSQSLSKKLQQGIFILFNLLIFFTPFVFTWLNQELFEFNKMLFVYALSAILLGLWLLRMILEKRWIFRKNFFTPFILIFLLSQLISTIISIEMRTSFFGYYSRFNGGLLSILSYSALYFVFINNISRKQVILLLESLVFSSFLLSLYAIPEHFGHSPSCYLITHKFDVACWREQVQIRIFGTFGQPNWLAAYLVMILPINLQFLFSAFAKKRNWKRISLFSLALLFSFLALLYTKSRSGLLAFLFSLLFFFLFQLIQKKLEIPKVTWQAFKRLCIRIVVTTSFFALLVLIAGSIYNPSLAERLSSRQPKTETTTELESGESLNRLEEGGSASSEIRKVVWTGAVRIWQRHPIFGSGVETFAYSYYLDRPVEHNGLSEWNLLYNKAHNELLNYLANTGIVGLLSYLSIFFALAWLFLNRLKERKLGEFDIAIVSSLIAMFISNFFGFSTVMSNLLFFIFLAIIVHENSGKPLQKENVGYRDQSNGLSLSQYLLTFLIGFLMLFSLKKVAAIWHADYLFTMGQNAFQLASYPQALLQIEEAIKSSPKEALFYDQLASDYSELALALVSEDATNAAKLGQAAVLFNDRALELNSRQLNFYKSRVSIFIKLAQMDRQYYQEAIRTLEKAIELAPTDAKLYYNLALLDAIVDNSEKAQELLEYTISIKSNYSQARNELAELYKAKKDWQKAAEQYQYILEEIDPQDKLVKEKLQAVEASLAAQVKSN